MKNSNIFSTELLSFSEFPLTPLTTSLESYDPSDFQPESSVNLTYHSSLQNAVNFAHATATQLTDIPKESIKLITIDEYEKRFSEHLKEHKLLHILDTLKLNVSHLVLVQTSPNCNEFTIIYDITFNIQEITLVD